MPVAATTPIVEASHTSPTGSWEMASRPPHPLLAGQVKGYCGYVERYDGPVTRREVPNGGVALILSFDQPINLVDMSNSPTPSGTFRSFVAGLHEGWAVTRHGGLQQGLQIDLTPLGGYRLLGLPMSEVANQVVELDAIRGREIGELVDRLASAPDWITRFDLLDDVLGTWVDRGPEVDSSVAWAWRQLEGSHGQVPVSVLADEIGWSRRHFGVRFREQVGLPPKPTARVLRFRRAVELLGRGGAVSIADVASTAGYADHSHLVREFRSLAGCTPSGLLAEQQPDDFGVGA